MFNSTMNDVARKRARFIRDVEYIKENIKDSRFQEALFVYESCGDGLRLESDIVSEEEDMELKKVIESFPVDDDSEKEVDRILTSKKPALSLDEVIGIHDSIDGDDGSSMNEISVMVNPEDDAEDTLEDFTEATYRNRDMYKEFKAVEKKYREAMKQAKKSFTKGDREKAKEALNEAAEALHQLESNIKDMDGSNASVMIGIISHSLTNCAKYTLLAIPTLGIGSLILSLNNTLNQVTLIANAAMKNKELSLRDFNFYRNKVLINVAKLQENIKKMKTALNEDKRYSESVEREIIRKYDLHITEDF